MMEFIFGRRDGDFKVVVLRIYCVMMEFIFGRRDGDFKVVVF